MDRESKDILKHCCMAAAMLLLFAFILLWNGIILLNNPNPNKYPVRGVDVSSYQGNINWEVLSSQDISFAFIKATEGSSFVDPYFEYNYTEAQKSDLRIGAYHFFSFDSEGETQADHFITTVNKIENMLPPVVDFEFYGDKERNPPEAQSARDQLDILLLKLEEYYGIKPIIYATEKSYSMYLSEYYQEYDIWIRNVISSPNISDNREWTFWQYTNREKLEGYDGAEKYIDMNVFCGSKEDFSRYAKCQISL